MPDPVPSPNCSYDPNKLLDALIDRLRLKNDAALARLLGVNPPTISKIRHRRLEVGASLLIRMHEETGLHVRDLRNLMGDRRRNYRYGDGLGKTKREARTADDALASRQADKPQARKPAKSATQRRARQTAQLAGEGA